MPNRRHACLVDGTIVTLRKDCSCRTHDGPHWLDRDRSWHATNSAMAARGLLLDLMGAITEERVRLHDKRIEFETRRIDRILSPEESAALPAAVRTSTGLRAYLKSVMHLSLNEAEGRLDSIALRAFTEVWTWSNYRMEAWSGSRQDRFVEKFGHEALKKRINKTRAAFGFAPLK